MVELYQLKQLGSSFQHTNFLDFHRAHFKSRFMAGSSCGESKDDKKLVVYYPSQSCPYFLCCACSYCM